MPGVRVGALGGCCCGVVARERRGALMVCDGAVHDSTVSRGHTGLMDIAAVRRLSKRGKAHRLRVDENCDKAGLSRYKF